MKRKIFGILVTLVLILTLVMAVTPAAAATVPTTFSYGDVALSGGFDSGHFLQVWDLTACDLTISFTYDANGLVDDFGGDAHAWAELGVREVGYGDFNPTWDVEGAGVWLATDYDWSVNTFDPDPVGSPTLDLDDKLILQKAGGHGEGDYNLPSTPPNPWANHRVWFDRDGVDQWQAQNPLAVDGGTYNTDGKYDVVITLQATSATSGEAYMTINGLDQGFETDGDWNTMELTPAGMTFTGDMTAMQVFYGLYGYGATHSVVFQDVTVAGCLASGTVTGGGWIDSPPGAYMPGLSNISGIFTGVYTSRFTDITCDPNNTPVTFTGWVEATGIQPNGAVMIGLVDQGLYDSGDSAWGSGAYLYLGRIGDNIRVGPTDGFYYGEINQVGANVPYVEGGPNLINFSMTIYDGQVTVTYGGNDYVDTYGEIEDANSCDAYPGSEFDSGAYVGLDSWPEENSVDYDIDIHECQCSGPTGKATFGFVSKYKKGAGVPDGQTEFIFHAGDLNFHSSSYEWLVIAGDTAKYKGTGSVNGEDGYRFMVWAGDGEPDTFRIRIWKDEIVIYDNGYYSGTKQPISGGNIVVHKK